MKLHKWGYTVYVNNKHYRTVWMEGSTVKMIDQPKLPHRFEIKNLDTHRDTAEAITTMVTRGAGAIGATAGFAMAQAALEALEADDFEASMREATDTIRHTRPTAQNLFYAIKRVNNAISAALPKGKEAAAEAAVKEAQAIADDDVAACEAIGKNGLAVIKENARVLTHCNAGWLAFVDWGSALSPVYAASRAGKNPFVWVDETRPRVQGARLTSWELLNENIKHAIIADNAAGFFFSRGEVDVAIVGADRIAANGDVANKIGTYEKALLAREHNVPFYVAAPTSTIDFDSPNGQSIPIEERSEDEVLCMWGLSAKGELESIRLAPEGSKARNPAFDITPAALITGFITERGIIKPEDLGTLAPEK